MSCPCRLSRPAVMFVVRRRGSVVAAARHFLRPLCEQQTRQHPITWLCRSISHQPALRPFLASPVTCIPATRLCSDSRTADPDEAESKEKEKRRESQVRATRYSLLALGTLLAGFAAFAVSENGPPRKDEHGNPIVDQFSEYSLVKQYLLRTWDAVWNWKQVLEEPVRELLLPDPLQAPYMQPPYTLIIEMNGILTHPEWTYKTGWRFKKRPFVDYLLQQCGPPLFELVIFTQDPGFTAHPLLDSLDPSGLIMYRLYRDSTRYVDGVRVKDLNCLNRDLSRVIHVDWNGDACKLNPNNCLVLKKWDGSDGDKSLFDLAQFIRAIATQEVEDVRDVLSHYRSFQDPLAAFKERQRQLLQQEQEAQQMASQKKSLVESFRRS